MKTDERQFGLEALLDDAREINLRRKLDAEHAHLPATMAEGIPYFRAMIDRHHAATLAADLDQIIALRKEARRLALKLNGFNAGTHANDDSPGYVLERACAAVPGEVPLWGQTGSFVIEAAGCRVLIEQRGMLGLLCGHSHELGFDAHAVDLDRPFVSPTGYRSWISGTHSLIADATPDVIAKLCIESYVAKEMKGRLVAIEPKWQPGKVAAA
jgi:hypothetical protein